MRRALESWLSNQPPEMVRRRVIGGVAVVVVHLLAFLIAFLMSPPFDLKKLEPELKNFRLMTLAEEKIAPEPRRVAQKKRVVPESPPAPEAPIALPSPLAMMLVSRDVFAASDISQIPSRNRESSNMPPASVSDGAIGKGPDGAPLYEGRLLRAPSFQEVFFYMPKETKIRTMSGTIICRILPNNMLDECYENGESPGGSGMARAMRRSAWIFRVQPDRIGDKPVVGSWVRFTYTLTVDTPK